MKWILLALGITFTCLACDDDNNQTLIDSTCYSFDVRQCQTDFYADMIPENESVNEREEKMMTWLEQQGASIDKVHLDINFHEAVCEACDVCPMGDRYFIQARIPLNINPDSLRLLNFQSETCSEVFN